MKPAVSLHAASHTRPRRRAGWILAACAVIVLFFLPLCPPSVVVSSHEKVLYEKRATDPLCQVVFRHSVNKGLVREVYRMNLKTCMLTLETGYFQSYGAGMPDHAADVNGEHLRQEGEYYVLDFAPVWQESIHYIGGNTAGHVFLYGEDSLDLGKRYPRAPFVLSVSRRSLIKKLLGRL